MDWKVIIIWGRLQLINSVITSMANFWMSAFRLPGSCLKEVERLCSAFLWSGPELKTSKANVRWCDVCLPKKEGGLGLRPLKEINTVLCLKLLWRLFSNRSSLWVKWIQCYLIRKGSFWSMKNSVNAGSWMLRKILKLRDLAKHYLRMEVHNGKDTSFWYDSWSPLGCLKDLLGERGTIGLGITENACVGEVLLTHRTRRHRLDVLNEVERELGALRSRSNYDDDDMALWRQDGNRFANTFSTKKTWLCMRQAQPSCNWNKGVWFPQSTPKFSFILWVAIRNRLQTCDRMQQWNTSLDTTCVLCQDEQEACHHLCFKCRYSSKVWKKLIGGILKESFTVEWSEILDIVSQSRSSFSATELFIIRCTFQALLHSVWMERNARRHGEQPREVRVLIKCVDKLIRLKLFAVKGKGKKYLEEGLCAWFGLAPRL